MLIRYGSDSRGKTVKKAIIYTKNEHNLQRDLIAPDALRIISHLRNYGFEAYLVGGAVRDMLIGKTPKDFDLVTNAEPAKIKRLFRNSRIIGKRFRLVHIFFGDINYEVSTFRSLVDGTTGNIFGTMDEDVRRRDFSLNALYYDPEKEQLIDYVGGVNDIRARRIKPVIPLNIIFKDDPVRLLRAVKYAVTTDCIIPFQVRHSIIKYSPLLQPVSPSRLTEEIIKILNSGNTARIIKETIHYKLFRFLQPMIFAHIKSSPKFSLNFFNSLQKLDDHIASDEDSRLGKKLVFLITDLIDEITDWNGLPTEVYNTVYNECRQFILPMNPPRIELDFAVRFCLKKGGLNIRLPRVRDKRIPFGTIDNNRIDADDNKAEHQNVLPSPETDKNRTTRKRHKKIPKKPVI